MAAKTRTKSDTPIAADHGSDRVGRIREGVMAAILEQRLLPGTKLGEDEIGDIYGASRTLVRTALLKLAHEGIVSIEKNRGAFVSRPSTADAREVFEARRLIEPTIVDYAIDAVSPAWLDRLHKHMAGEREAELRGDARAMVRLSGEFHRLVAEMSGHNVYLGFLQELIARSSLIILLYRRHDTPACGTGHHAEIVMAIHDRDKARARALMIGHLVDIEAELFLKDVVPDERRLADVLEA
jgi:DNA-binding GntR family transcriptional regulator